MKRLLALLFAVFVVAPSSLAAVTPERTYPIYNTNCYSRYCVRNVSYNLTPTPYVPVGLQDYSAHQLLYLRSNSNPNIVFNNYQDYLDYQKRFNRYYYYNSYYGNYYRY